MGLREIVLAAALAIGGCASQEKEYTWVDFLRDNLEPPRTTVKKYGKEYHVLENGGLYREIKDCFAYIAELESREIGVIYLDGRLNLINCMPSELNRPEFYELRVRMTPKQIEQLKKMQEAEALLRKNYKSGEKELTPVNPRK